MGYPCEKKRADMIYHIITGKMNDKSVPEEIEDSDECRCSLPSNVICRGLGEITLMDEKIHYAEIQEIDSDEVNRIIGEINKNLDSKGELYEFFDPVPV